MPQGSGAHNPPNIQNGLVGNLKVNNFDGGQKAGRMTVWRGDGHWASTGMTSVSPSGDVTGATDVTNITAAITSVSSAGGGTVLLNSGTWYTNASIVIPSNVIISGAGNSSLPSGGGTSSGGTVINALNNSTCLAVQAVSATVTSWGIRDLCINLPASSSSAIGITLDSCQRGILDNVGINVGGASQIGLLLRPSNGGNCDNNNISRVIISLGTFASATGISVTSASISYNTSFVYFTDSQIFLGANSQTGLYLGLTDSCQFLDLTMVGLTGGLAPVCIQFDYTAGFAGWPASTHFFGLDHGFNMTPGAGRVTNVGSPSGATPNVIYAFSQANADALPALANLEIVGDRYVLVSRQIGYSPGSGAGGTVSQITNIGTSVTLNAACGQITTVSNAFTAGTIVSFAVINNFVAATDTVIVNVGTTSAGSAICFVAAVGTGSFNVAIDPLQTATFTVTINFSIIKAVTT